MASETTYEQDQSQWGKVTDSGKERMYVSKQGDTLEDIAAFFYGDPKHRQRIIDDNPEWASYQPGAALPTGTRLKVSEDVSRGDTLSQA